MKRGANTSIQKSHWAVPEGRGQFTPYFQRLSNLSTNNLLCYVECFLLDFDLSHFYFKSEIKRDF
jgi:hypothetical protein